MFYLFLFDLKIRKICNSYSQLPNESSAEVGLVLKKLKTDLQKIQNRYCINLLWFFGRLDFAIYLGLFDWFHGNQFFKNPWKSDVKNWIFNFKNPILSIRLKIIEIWIKFSESIQLFHLKQKILQVSKIVLTSLLIFNPWHSSYRYVWYLKFKSEKTLNVSSREFDKTCLFIKQFKIE